MANGKFSYGAYRLSWLQDEACAVTGDTKNRKRYRLGVFKSEGEEAARSALISFVLGEERTEAIKDGTVGSLWNLYRKDREKDGKVMRAFDAPWKHLSVFFADRCVSEINKDLCRAYAMNRFETGKARGGKAQISPDTVWTELNKLSSCLSWAAQNRHIGQNKDDVPPMWFPKRTEKSDEVLTPSQVQALIDACSFTAKPNKQGERQQDNAHMKLFIVLAMCTGGRPTAILELTWDRVDFNERLIDLRTKDEADPMSKAYKKARAEVYMNDLALTALIEAKERATSKYVIEYNGSRVLRISKGFRNLVKRAGLPKWVTPHKLRHAVATWVDKAGVDPKFTAQLLGHGNKSAVTEARYIHRSGEDTKAAAQVIDQALGGQRLRVVK
jgi:integrase